MNNLFQQNKNKFNKISALITSETKKNSKKLLSSIDRSGYITLFSNQTLRLNVLVSSKISSELKIVEGSGKIFWCWEIERAEVSSLSGRHLSIGKSDSQSIHDGVNKFLSFELDETQSSWKKVLNFNVLKDLFPNGLDINSKAFVDIQQVFIDIFESRVSIEREESILKTIKNPNLFPVLWYNINGGSYSIQNYDNYSNTPSVSERKTLDEYTFESSVRGFISETVSYSIKNLDNWGVVGFSDKRFERLGGGVNSRRY